jgi:hypothetical protein
VPRQ